MYPTVVMSPTQDIKHQLGINAHLSRDGDNKVSRAYAYNLIKSSTWMTRTIKWEERTCQLISFQWFISRRNVFLSTIRISYLPFFVIIISKFISAKRFHRSIFSSFTSIFGSARFVVWINVYGDREASEWNSSSSKKFFRFYKQIFTRKWRHIFIESYSKSVSRGWCMTINKRCRWSMRIGNSRWWWCSSNNGGRCWIEHAFGIIFMRIDWFWSFVRRCWTDCKHRFWVELRL